MSQLRDKMKMDLELKGFSPNTKKAYLKNAERFANHFAKSPAMMGESEIREYLRHLASRNVSDSYISSVYSSLNPGENIYLIVFGYRRVFTQFIEGFHTF